MGVLAAIPLSPDDAKVPDGLRYHVLDVFVEELDRVDTPRCGGLPLGVLLGPVRGLERGGRSRAVRARAREALGDERLRDWEGIGAGDKGDSGEVGEGGEDSESGEEEWAGIDD